MVRSAARLHPARVSLFLALAALAFLTPLLPHHTVRSIAGSPHARTTHTSLFVTPPPPPTGPLPWPSSAWDLVKDLKVIVSLKSVACQLLLFHPWFRRRLYCWCVVATGRCCILFSIRIFDVYFSAVHLPEKVASRCHFPSRSLLRELCRDSSDLGAVEREIAIVQEGARPTCFFFACASAGASCPYEESASQAICFL